MNSSEASMRSELTLGVRLSPETFTAIKLTDIDLNIKVEELRSETAQRVNLTKDSFDLIYCGCILEDELTLESSGVKSGTMVHVLKRNDPEPTPVPKCNTEDSISRVATEFKLFVENPARETVLHRMIKNQEFIDSVISFFPELNYDPVAIAILQAVELMELFADKKTVEGMAKWHPVLIPAAQHIAVMSNIIHNVEAFGASGMMSTTQPAANSYGLDNFSDEEEMAGDSSQSSDSMQPPPLQTTRSSSAPGIITTAQLAAALPSARSQIAAMQQTLTPPTVPTILPNLPPFLPPVLPQLADLQSQLAQMHEMGLQDDAINVQALQFTNGDVQAAIELVFSGFF